MLKGGYGTRFSLVFSVRGVAIEDAYLIPELRRLPVEGFSAGLVNDDDIYKWEVLVIGPPDTL